MSGTGVAFLVIAVLILLLISYKLYLVLTTGWDRSPTCLVGKTAIVTGSNRGIGFYTAQDFAKRGARVILACRDRVRGEEAKTKIIETTRNPNVVLRIVDLASLESVRKFAEKIKNTERGLHILVNNAGVGGLSHTVTPDELSLSMQINYFGPFLLTNLLLDLLKGSAPSRIVNVSSGAANLAKLDLNDLNAFPRSIFAKIIDYSNSKFCVILFTNELARRLKESGVVANSVNPGFVKTDFMRFLPRTFRKIVDGVSEILYKTAEEGAQTSIYAAVSAEVSGVSGEYFMDCKKSWMPRSGRDEELAKRVWEKSEEFVKLRAEV